MIDPINKKYRLSGGSEWRYYGSSKHEIHGASKNYWDQWRVGAWHAETGKYLSGDVIGMELVEVKERIKRTVWLHVFTGGSTVATETPPEYDITNRLACVKVEIDCEEGEGL